MTKRLVALSPFLIDCPLVTTLGLRPSIMDYSAEERSLLRSADLVLFPSLLFARVLQSAGIPTFPRCTTYLYRTSRRLQFSLFKISGLSIPKTRTYYGKGRDSKALRDFSLPFRVLSPSPDAAQRELEIRTPEDMATIPPRWNPLIVQEWIPWEERLNLICTNFQIVGASSLDLESSKPLPFGLSRLKQSRYSQTAELTDRLLTMARLDDVCVEWGREGSGWRLLSLRRPPARWVTPEGTTKRFSLLCEEIAAGSLTFAQADRKPKDPESRDQGFSAFSCLSGSFLWPPRP